MTVMYQRITEFPLNVQSFKEQAEKMGIKIRNIDDAIKVAKIVYNWDPKLESIIRENYSELKYMRKN